MDGFFDRCEFVFLKIDWMNFSGFRRGAINRVSTKSRKSRNIEKRKSFIAQSSLDSSDRQLQQR